MKRFAAILLPLLMVSSSWAIEITSGVTDQYIYFVALDATDRVTPETGLSSFTVRRSRNGGASAAYTTPTVNETDSSNMPGVYELLLDEDMTIDAGDDTQEVVLYITHAGMAPVTRTYTLIRPKITAGNTLSVESDGDVTKVNALDGHTPQTGDAFGRLGAPAGASVSADNAAIKSVVDAIKAVTDLLTGNRSEPTGVPAANAPPLTKLDWLYFMGRNRIDESATEKTFYDDGNSPEFKKTKSVSGNTKSESEVASP